MQLDELVVDVDELDDMALMLSLPGLVAFTMSWVWTLLLLPVMLEVWLVFMWLVLSICLISGESSMKANVFFKSSKAKQKRKKILGKNSTINA